MIKEKRQRSIFALLLRARRSRVIACLMVWGTIHIRGHVLQKDCPLWTFAIRGIFLLLQILMWFCDSRQICWMVRLWKTAFALPLKKQRPLSLHLRVAMYWRATASFLNVAGKPISAHTGVLLIAMARILILFTPAWCKTNTALFCPTHCQQVL